MQAHSVLREGGPNGRRKKRTGDLLSELPMTTIYRFCKKLICAKEVSENSQEGGVSEIGV